MSVCVRARVHMCICVNLTAKLYNIHTQSEKKEKEIIHISKNLGILEKVNIKKL